MKKTMTPDLWENQIMGGNNTRGAKNATNHGIIAYENIQ
jgi:hypothetical protein